MPFRCLGSEQEGLLEDSKGPPQNRHRTIQTVAPPTLEAHLTLSKRLKTSLRRLQDGLRCPKTQRSLKSPQDAPKMSQDASKIRFWWSFGSKMEASWYQNQIQTSILDYFANYFG